MQGDDATRHSVGTAALKNNVTAALPNLTEAKAFESADRFCPLIHGAV
jgi:hypothetical protein